ncbi:MAG: LamG domain-containing protein [Sedimentisphaerales bacterium]|nr:LamG domain-containing protein [Sedimentisphaerales bacterium]
MPGVSGPVSVIVVLLCVTAVSAGEAALEYPSALLDVYDADQNCWRGMDADGLWRDGGDGPGVSVVPARWLVGPPPSDLSAVTFPEDHWIHLGYSGRIVDNDGNDIVLVESGRVGEQALIFLTDGADQEYVAGLAVAENSGEQALTYIALDLAGIEIPFEARGLRVVAVDLGGGSPGFDLANIQARVSHDAEPRATCPNPVSGARDIAPHVELRWTPGSSTREQVVYFGDVASEVRSGAPGIRYPAQPHDANTFAPPELSLGRTYYWRVDEIGADANPRGQGDVWSFTVSDRIVVDDFESYDLLDNYLYESWPVRSWAWTSLEWDVIRSCLQSMLFEYHYDAVYFAETFRQFERPQDWTRHGVQGLQVMLHGKPGNATDGRLYLTLGDGATEQYVLYQGDMDALARDEWSAWRIAFDDFNGVDLSHIESMAIGLRPLSPQPGHRSEGTIYLDDICLYPHRCLMELQPAADVTADCAVDYRDVERMAADWLEARPLRLPVETPNDPVLWYRFDGHTGDDAGGGDGEMHGRPTYAPGRLGQALHFMNQNDAVTVPEPAAVFAGIREAITIAFWQHGDDSPHVNDTVCCSNYVYGQSNPAVAVNLGLWRDPGQYRWDCGSPWSMDNRLAGHHQSRRDWAGRWNHWVFTKDVRPSPHGETGRMEIYLNGVLYDSRTGTDSPIENVTSFAIGSGWYGHYDGLIDDFRIYDYALSAPEAAWLATDGTGVFDDPISFPADLNADDRVDLRDFTILADQWLETGLWP